MAALAGSAFNWTRVSGGIWTKVYSGPVVAAVPFQGLELAALSPGGFRTIRWTLEGFSAQIPFYYLFGGSDAFIRFIGSPPVGHIGRYTATVPFGVSPWVEFNLLTDIACFAHIVML